MEQPLAKADAQKLIRRAAQRADGVGFRGYAVMRMRQRRLDALDVVRVFRNAVQAKPAYGATLSGATRSRDVGA